MCPAFGGGDHGVSRYVAGLCGARLLREVRKKMQSASTAGRSRKGRVSHA